jgi:hypothetical protein
LKPLQTFLIVLLLVAPLDDVWAMTTPDPANAAAAFQNNDYTPALRPFQPKRSNTRDLPGHCLPASLAVKFSGTAAIPPEPEQPRLKTPVGPSLLLALMSLQR